MQFQRFGKWVEGFERTTNIDRYCPFFSQSYRFSARFHHFGWESCDYVTDRSTSRRWKRQSISIDVLIFRPKSSVWYEFSNPGWMEGLVGQGKSRRNMIRFRMYARTGAFFSSVSYAHGDLKKTCSDVSQFFRILSEFSLPCGTATPLG